jgi:hypothetical protein
MPIYMRGLDATKLDMPGVSQIFDDKSLRDLLYGLGFGGSGGGISSLPPKKRQKEPKLDKAKRCASAQLGLDDLADLGAAVSGMNILETRGKFGGATAGTSIASRAASAVFGQAKLPFRVPTIVGNPLTLNAAVRFTSSVARVAGRAIPVVGWSSIAYDGAKIAQCVASDD